MWRRLLGGLAALLALCFAAYLWLVPREAVRPLPAGISEPRLVPVAVPFTHRWARKTSHPLLAAAAIDIDGDGRDEVFLGGSDGQKDGLIAWRDGRLVDIAAEVGLGGESATYGALSIDIDGDGNVDLVTVGSAGLVLWINRGGWFERRPYGGAMPVDAVPVAVTAGDFDRDGMVDLYLSMFVSPAHFRRNVFNDPTHAKRNMLLRNEGDLAFNDVTDAVTGGAQNTFVASFVDLDRDGWPDLVLAHDTGEVEILRNLKGRFVRAGIRSGLGFWKGLAFGDIDNDGDLDIFLSNIGNSVPARFVKGDRRDDQRPASEWLLLRNDGDFRFTDITAAAGLSGFGTATGAAFEDVNLDGALDLLVAQNSVAWPVQRLFKLPGKMLLGAPGTSPGFYTGKSGVNPSYGHVPLVADLDGDGRNDIVWANVDGPARAYLNRSEGRFVAVRLPDTPRSIGARVRLEGARVPVHTHIAGQGLTSDRTTQATIGLGKDDPAPTALIVEWPDGTVTRIDNPRLNEPITIPAR